jgi:hypothetical protein
MNQNLGSKEAWRSATGAQLWKSKVRSVGGDAKLGIETVAKVDAEAKLPGGASITACIGYLREPKEYSALFQSGVCSESA